jgi:hypothetical protein
MSVTVDEASTQLTYLFQQARSVSAQLEQEVTRVQALTLPKAVQYYNAYLQMAESTTSIGLDMPWKEGLTILLKESKKIPPAQCQKLYFDFRECRMMLSKHFSAKKQLEKQQALAEAEEHKEAPKQASQNKPKDRP